MKTVIDFIVLGSKITADGDCSHEIKRCLLLERQAMTNLDSILKSRNIALPTRVHLVNAMVFPAVMYGCENWMIRKAEHQRTNAFELWCWRRLLRVPGAARISNSSVLKEIRPEYSLEGLMLKLKLQYFDHLMWRTDTVEKTLMLEKIEGRIGWQRARWLDSITDSLDMNWAISMSWWWTEKPGCYSPWIAKSQTQLSDWTELMRRTYNMKWLVSLYDWCVGALVSTRMYVL